MAGGFSISATLNASKFLRGVKDIDGALEDLEGSLDDVADEVKKVDKADGFKDLAKDADKAEDAASDLEKRLRKVRDEAKDVGKSTGSIGDDGSRNFRKMGDAAEEVSGELKQNLGETFSSFRGDLEDLPQIAQDVFGGLAGSVGGIMPAIGLAAGAAGIGLLVAAFQNLQEEENARKERVHEWAQAYRDAAADITESVASMAAINAIYDDTERYAEAEKNAKNWGVTVSTAVNAMAGDMTALGIVENNLAENTAIVDDAVSKLGNGGIKGLGYEMRQLKDQTAQGTAAFDALTGGMEEGRVIAEQNAQSLYMFAQSTGTATGEVDDLGNAIIALPDGTEVVINAATGKAYANVDALEQNIQGVQGKTVGVGVDTSGASAGLNNWVSQNNGKTIKIYGKYVSPAGANVP